MTLREHASMSTQIIWYSALAVVIVGVVSFLSIWLRPAWLGFEREAFKSSHQYIESARTAIVTYCEEYREAEKEVNEYENSLALTDMETDEGKKQAETLVSLIDGSKNHMKSIKSKIKQKASQLDESEVPEEAKKILGR